MRTVLPGRKDVIVARERRNHGVGGRRHFGWKAGAAARCPGAPSSPLFPKDGGRPCPVSALARLGPGVPERRHLLSSSRSGPSAEVRGGHGLALPIPVR